MSVARPFVRALDRLNGSGRYVTAMVTLALVLIMALGIVQYVSSRRLAKKNDIETHYQRQVEENQKAVAQSDAIARATLRRLKEIEKLLGVKNGTQHRPAAIAVASPAVACATPGIGKEGRTKR